MSQWPEHSISSSNNLLTESVPDPDLVGLDKLVIGVPKPIPEPITKPVLTARDLFAGPPVPPSGRIRLYGPTDWEEFIEEWAYTAAHSDGRYAAVHRIGGSGDEGRDIIGYVTDDRVNGPWDNFQCKHYTDPLTPTDVWPELAKLAYYTWLKAYSIPRKYYFVAPKDAGSTLIKLLEKSDELKRQLIATWDKTCAKKITSKKSVPLNGPLLAYIEQFDFSIVRLKPVHEIIDEHSKTRYHLVRFGGPPTRPRPESELPPSTPSETETQYVRQLLEVIS